MLLEIIMLFEIRLCYYYISNKLNKLISFSSHIYLFLNIKDRILRLKSINEITAVLEC